MDDLFSSSAPGFHALVHAASLAPSSHNTQPWLFRLGEKRIDVLADRTRALPVNDPNDREMTISCGCALMNLRVAAAAQGQQAAFELLPDAAAPDLLATVRLVPAPSPQHLAELHAAIELRRTHRERFSETAITAGSVHELADVVRDEGAMLAVLETTEQRSSAAELVGQGDAVQWADAHWRRELAAWMHPRRCGDGLTVPDLAVPIAQLVVRTFDMGKGMAAKDQQISDESPVLAVLGTQGDSARDWLIAGQALQRLLLAAARQGLQASFLNQPVQVPALRPALQRVSGSVGHPQVLLRLGVPRRAVPAAPRRKLTDLVVSV